MKLYDDQYVVITGGAGFIGSNVIKRLNDEGFTSIIIVDDLGTSEKWKNLVGKKFEGIVSRYEIFDWLKGRESEIEAFIHLGACSSTVERDADYLYTNNTLFSQQLCEYALENGHRFIYASSAATYGNGEQGFSDDPSGLQALSPLNMYGFSKHLFDLWLQKHGLLNKVTGLKYFNVFGPNEYHKGRMASAIVHFTRQIAEKGAVKLFKSSEPDKFEDGGQLRDFVYVKDVAKITADLLKKDVFGIYNMGTGTPHTWLELANGVFKGLKLPPKIEFVDMPEDLVGKYQNYTAADMGRFEGEFGSIAWTPFEESVIEYVEDYLVKEEVN